MDTSIKEPKEKIIQKIYGYKCSNDGKFFVGHINKKCRYCTPIYDKTEWDKLKKR